MLVQRHSHLRSLTSWAKCLRNAPCQCTAHATASADIWLFKSENVPRTGTFSLNKHEISIRNKELEGYQLRYYILRFAGRLSWSITFRLFLSFKFCIVEWIRCGDSVTSYRDGQRKAGCSWAGALAGAFRRHFAAFVRESKSSAIARRFPLSSYKRSTGWGKAGSALRRNILLSASDPSLRIYMPAKRITPTATNFSNIIPQTYSSIPARR